MSDFVAILASGVSQGAIYALVALGIVLLQNATGVINFAQGDLMTLGAYVGFWCITTLGMSQLPMFAVMLVLLFGAGVLMERVGYAPIRNRSPLVIVISTFALGLALRAAIVLWQGSDPRDLPSPFGNRTFDLFGANVPYQSLLTVGVTIVVGIGLYVIFQRSSLGRQVRALAADRETALLQGIRVKRLSPLIFGLSAALAGLAGVLIAPIISATPNLGFALLLSAFAAVILGGERLGGVAFAAMFIAIAQALLGRYLSPDYTDAYPFIILAVVLAIRPEGLVKGVSGVRY
jgi:branched-chain amino acid transport system permease protein